jgi:hypothetical protein
MLPNRTLRGKTEYLCWIDSRSLLWNVLVKLVNLEKCHSCTYAGTMSAVKPREGGDTPRSWNKTWLSALLLGTPPRIWCTQGSGKRRSRLFVGRGGRIASLTLGKRWWRSLQVSWQIAIGFLASGLDKLWLDWLPQLPQKWIKACLFSLCVVDSVGVTPLPRCLKASICLKGDKLCML